MENRLERFPKGEPLVMSSEFDNRPAVIKWLGRLDGAEQLDAEPSKRIWKGRISAKLSTLQERWQLSAADCLKKLEDYKDRVNDYFVETVAGVAVRCIDGRPKQGVFSNDGTDIEADRRIVAEEHLGPQTPGGSPGAALAHRVAEFFSLEPGNIYEDTQDTKKRYDELALPFPVGGHDDIHAEYPNIGCAAIDKLPEIMEHLDDEESESAVKKYAQAIVGDEWDEQQYLNVRRIIKQINEPEYKKRYLMEVGGEYEYKHLTIEALKEETVVEDEKLENVETMVGAHKEILLIINKQAGTTFHRDLFCLDTGNEAQVFNYDYWQSRDRANALYGDNEDARKRFLIFRAMYAVSTAMILTDGSLQLGVRS
jgi:hypothetical protein